MPPRPSLVTPQLLDALATKESRRNPKAVGDKGKALGEYQMWKIAYDDVQAFFPQEFGQIPYAQLKTDRALQRRAAAAYLKVGEQKYGITDFARLVSFYNRGPKARIGPITNQAYVDDVKQFLEGGNPMAAPDPQSKVDPIERGIMRIGRLTHRAGFGMLTAKEIAPILAQVDPPGVLPGVKPPKPDRLAQERDLTSMLSQVLHQGKPPTEEGAPMSFLPQGSA